MHHDELEQRILSALPAYVFFHNIDRYLNTTGATPDPMKLGCDSVDEAYELVFSIFSLIVKRELEEVDLTMAEIVDTLKDFSLQTTETLSLKEIGIRIVIEILMNGSAPMMPYNSVRISFITSQSSTEEKGKVIYKPTQQGLKFYFSTHEYEAYLENLNGMRFDLMLLEEKINAGDYKSAVRNAQRIYAAIVTQHAMIEDFYEKIAAQPLATNTDEMFKEKREVVDALNDAKQRLEKIMKHADMKIEGLQQLNDEEKMNQYAPALREISDLSNRCLSKDAQTIALYMGLDAYWQKQVLAAAQADHPQRFSVSELTSALQSDSNPINLEDLLSIFMIKPLPKTFSLSRLDETKEEKVKNEEDYAMEKMEEPEETQRYHYDEIAKILLSWLRDHLAIKSPQKLSEMMPYPHELVAHKEETGGYVTSVLIDLYQSCNGMDHDMTPLDRLAQEVGCPSFVITAIQGTCATLDGELDHDLIFEVKR